MACLTSDTNFLTFPVAFFQGFSLAVCYLVPYSMLPDVIEADELKTGKRREGQYSGFFVVFMKLSVTGALALSNFVLGHSEF
eukprot:GSMAST32.ASY1.ANO1.1759.1 assembled CDS